MISSIFYRNVELSTMFRVSNVTIGRYITQAEEGKNNLELIKINGKKRISRNEKNLKVLEKIIGSDERFKNKGPIPQCEMNTNFYDLFTTDQVLELVSNIKISSFIPQKFNNIISNHINATIANKVKISRQVSNDENFVFSDRLVGMSNNETKYNLICLGINIEASYSKLILSLKEKGLINKTLLVDISQESNEKNIKFLKKNNLDSGITIITMDFGNANISNKIFSLTKLSRASDEDSKNINTKNLYLIGSSINLDQKHGINNFENIIDSAVADDIFITHTLLDSNAHFRFAENHKESDNIKEINGVLDFLGFRKNLYKVEKYIDFENSSNIIYAEIVERFDMIFSNILAEKIKVSLKKGDKIILKNQKYYSLTDFAVAVEDFNLETIEVRKSYDNKMVLGMFEKK